MKKFFDAVGIKHNWETIGMVYYAIGITACVIFAVYIVLFETKLLLMRILLFICLLAISFLVGSLYGIYVVDGDLEWRDTK